MKPIVINKTEKYKLARRLMLPLCIVFAIFYLLFHVLSGERGLYAMLREERRLELLKKELSEVAIERKAIESHIRLVSEDSIDLDMLDEQAHTVLDAASENEVVIPLHTDKPPIAAQQHK